MSIFSENCLAYLKKGFSVIPDAGKKPLIKDWTRFSDKQPSKEDIEEWCSNYKKANISVMMGSQSGVIALDFDELDPEIIKIVEPLLPESPVERIGSKGFVRFFQYSGEPNQTVWVKDTEAKSGKRVVLEILSEGKKVTVAPSIHPKTNKPYIWTDKGLLDVDISELPKLPPMLVASIQSKLKFLESSSNSYDDTSKVTEGRNISLTSYVTNLLKNPHTINEAIDKLVEYDKENHDVPLFTDPKEQEVVNANYNAMVFYLNHFKYVNKKRISEGKGLELPIFNNETKVLESLTRENKRNENDVLPKPTGLMRDIYEHILANSYIEQPIFALSASIALLAVLSSRKFLFQSTTTNIYLLNIAESGMGKDSCQQIIKDLLYEIGAGQKLLGATAYPSEASIIQNIDALPVRLDIIDEASTFLSAATKGGNTYAQGIGDTLCELYSCSNSYYLGKSLASSAVKIGAVHRPHISLLCSTTPRGIHESISITSLEKGLFARFLVFFGDNDVAGKRVVKKTRPSKEMLDKLNYLYKFVNPKFKEGNFTKYNTPAYKIGLTRKANDRLTEIHREFDELKRSLKSDSYTKPIAARLYQQMLKIIMLSAIGNVKIGKLPLVRPDDVEFGYQFIKYFFDNIKDFVNDNMYSTHREQKLNKLLNIIKDTGNEGLSNVELARQAKYLSTGERIDFIKDLKEAGRIIIKADDDETNNANYRFFYIGEG